MYEESIQLKADRIWSREACKLCTMSQQDEGGAGERENQHKEIEPPNAKYPSTLHSTRLTGTETPCRPTVACCT